MNDVQLVCRGLEVGGYYISPFEVHSGSVITLRLPVGIDPDDRLTAVLTGLVPCPEIQLTGSCVVANAAQPPIGWRRWLSDPRPVAWLVGHGFSSDQAEEIVARHGIDNRFRLSRHAATPRTLLGLEVAYRSGASIVIFNTSGLDPRGRSAVFDLVRANLVRTAAVYLATPFVSQGLRQYSDLPGSHIIEIAPHAAVTI
jgi:hypothetical protein